jgi:hypothetical protein
MLLDKPLPFIEDFINELNKGLKSYKPDEGLNRIQRGWIGFCLMGIILTNSVCWARFERVSLGKYKLGALSWMFRKSKIPWEMMLQVSIAIVLKQYGISEGTLVTDDSDHKRSKKTPRLFKSHKIRDKGSGGYINGQNIVLLILVTDKVSLPVGFEVYQPDPQQQAWKREDKRLTKKGIVKKERPKAPTHDPEYPTKPELALRLIGKFREHHSQIKIKAIIADALYGQAKFMDAASALFGGIQVISQLRYNQNIRFRGRRQSLRHYFSSYPGVSQELSIRGQPAITANVGSIRVEVCAHGKKRFVIALKYPSEQDYRYLVATDMTWRTIDIIQAYTLRWLVEVFIEDWKSYEGWAQLAKQTGKEGTSRGLTLSLLLDLCLLLHPRQIARVESKLPAYTVGILLRNIQMEAFLLYFEQLLQAPNPVEELIKLSQSVQVKSVSARVFPSLIVWKTYER